MRRRYPPASPAHGHPASRLHRDLQLQAGPQERGLDQVKLDEQIAADEQEIETLR